MEDDKSLNLDIRFSFLASAVDIAREHSNENNFISCQIKLAKERILPPKGDTKELLS